MKAQELRKLSNDKLEQMERDLQIELIKDKCFFGKAKSGDKVNPKGVTNKGVRTHVSRQIRKNIAKIKTILNERRLQDDKEKRTRDTAGTRHN